MTPTDLTSWSATPATITFASPSVGSRNFDGTTANATTAGPVTVTLTTNRAYTLALRPATACFTQSNGITTPKPVPNRSPGKPATDVHVSASVGATALLALTPLKAAAAASCGATTASDNIALEAGTAGVRSRAITVNSRSTWSYADTPGTYSLGLRVLVQ